MTSGTGGTLSSVRPKWRGRRGHLYWTHRGIPMRWLKYIRVGEARIRLFTTAWHWLPMRRQTEQKTTDRKMPVCSPRWRPKSRGCLLVRVSMLGRLVFCLPVWSNPLVPFWPLFQLTVDHIIKCVMPAWGLLADQAMKSLRINQWSASTIIWYAYAVSETDFYYYILLLTTRPTIYTSPIGLSILYWHKQWRFQREVMMATNSPTEVSIFKQIAISRVKRIFCCRYNSVFSEYSSTAWQINQSVTVLWCAQKLIRDLANLVCRT